MFVVDCPGLTPCRFRLTIMQGRLPIKVELKGLSEDDMYKILTEPVTNLIKQQIELMKTEVRGSVRRGLSCKMSPYAGDRFTFCARTHLNSRLGLFPDRTWSW